MAYLVYDESRRGPLALTPYKYGDRGPRILGMSLIVEATPSSVYTRSMANKKRVNITIDAAVHEEMRKFLELTDSDFSGFIEQLTVRFLGQMRPVIRRMEQAQSGGQTITPSELRVMFLQMMGSVQVEAGAELNTILQELDIVEAEQQKKKAALEEKPKSIHTPKPSRSTKAKK